MQLGLAAASHHVGTQMHVVRVEAAVVAVIVGVVVHSVVVVVEAVHVVVYVLVEVVVDVHAADAVGVHEDVVWAVDGGRGF